MKLTIAIVYILLTMNLFAQQQTSGDKRASNPTLHKPDIDQGDEYKVMVHEAAPAEAAQLKNGNGNGNGTGSGKDPSDPVMLPSFKWCSSTRKVGAKTYELKSHLQNVNAVVSDKKLAQQTATVIWGYEPEVVSWRDYYAFGSGMPGRTISSPAYRYGFNGTEKDDEILGNDNSYNYGFRLYDARVARFFSCDPIESKFPWNSPYAFAENMPIQAIDLEGLERFKMTHFITSTGQYRVNVKLTDPDFPTLQVDHYTRRWIDGKQTYRGSTDDFYFQRVEDKMMMFTEVHDGKLWADPTEFAGADFDDTQDDNGDVMVKHLNFNINWGSTRNGIFQSNAVTGIPTGNAIPQANYPASLTFGMGNSQTRVQDAEADAVHVEAWMNPALIPAGQLAAYQAMFEAEVTARFGNVPVTYLSTPMINVAPWNTVTTTQWKIYHQSEYTPKDPDDPVIDPEW